MQSSKTQSNWTLRSPSNSCDMSSFRFGTKAQVHVIQRLGGLNGNHQWHHSWRPRAWLWVCKFLDKAAHLNHWDSSWRTWVCASSTRSMRAATSVVQKVTEGTSSGSGLHHVAPRTRPLHLLCIRCPSCAVFQLYFLQSQDDSGESLETSPSLPRAFQAQRVCLCVGTEWLFQFWGIMSFSRDLRVSVDSRECHCPIS